MTDINQPFKLDIGFPVPPDSAAGGEFKTRKVEPFKCATVLFSGPESPNNVVLIQVGIE